VTAGEKTDCELLDDLLLADDHFSKFLFQGLVFLAELIDGGDVIGWQGAG
jgi:hypothetical protein